MGIILTTRVRQAPIYYSFIVFKYIPKNVKNAQNTLNNTLYAVCFLNVHEKYFFPHEIRIK